jgi:hypothetical protein
MYVLICGITGRFLPSFILPRDLKIEKSVSK